MFDNPLYDFHENIGVFLAPGFEEGTAVFCTDRLRNAGLPVSIVGISGQTVKGMHGITIEPDQTIGDIDPNKSFRLILISGGRQYISSSMYDPRVCKQLQNTIKTNGYIAPIARVKEILEASGIVHEGTPNIISNNDKELKEFVDELIKLVTIEAAQPDVLH